MEKLSLVVEEHALLSHPFMIRTVTHTTGLTLYNVKSSGKLQWKCMYVLSRMWSAMVQYQ